MSDKSSIPHDLPGIIKQKYRERGGTDYRKDAKLDLYEFTSIVIETVLERNEKIMMKYPLEKELVWAGIEPSANNIFNWAISHKKGSLRTQAEKKLRFYLLRHGTASLTDRGIKFRKMHYTCKIAREENWFSRINKSQTFEIAFDSRCMNTILLYDKRNKRYIEFEINRQLTSNSKYIDRSLEEIENYDENILAKNKIYTDKNDESSIKHRRKRTEITKSADEKSRNRGPVIINNIEQNKAIEKVIHGEIESLVRNPHEFQKDDSMGNSSILGEKSIHEKVKSKSRQSLQILISKKLTEDLS